MTRFNTIPSTADTPAEFTSGQDPQDVAYENFLPTNIDPKAEKPPLPVITSVSHAGLADDIDDGIVECCGCNHHSR